MNKLFGIFLLFGLQIVCTFSQNPFEVYIALSFNSVSKVDGVEQSFEADFYLISFWIDNNVNFTNGYNPDVDFNPNIEFANSKGQVSTQIDNPFYSESSPPSEDIFGGPVPDGVWVRSDQRYIGNFNTKLRLENFPYDKQDVLLYIESSLSDNTQLIIKGVKNLKDKMIKTKDDGTYDFEILEWNLLSTETNDTEFYYASFDQTYSRLEIKINLQRQSSYYVWKIFLGSILLVIMCICTFMLEVSEPDRMMGTITVFLALISFLFVAGTSIPKVAYQTKLDNFMNFSFFIVFFILIAHTVNYFFREEEEQEEGDKDQIEMKNRNSTGETEVKKRKAFSLAGTPLSRKLDLSFAILFSCVYLVGCLAIIIPENSPY